MRNDDQDAPRRILADSQAERRRSPPYRSLCVDDVDVT